MIATFHQKPPIGKPADGFSRTTLIRESLTGRFGGDIPLGHGNGDEPKLRKSLSQLAPWGAPGAMPT